MGITLFDLGDGIRTRSVELKHLGKEIRYYCKQSEKFKKKLSRADKKDQEYYARKCQNALQNLSHAMKKYTSKMVEVNSHLVEIGKKLK